MTCPGTLLDNFRPACLPPCVQLKGDKNHGIQIISKKVARRRKGASPRQSGRDPAGAKAFQFEDVIHP